MRQESQKGSSTFRHDRVKTATGSRHGIMDRPVLHCTVTVTYICTNKIHIRCVVTHLINIHVTVYASIIYIQLWDEMVYYYDI